MTQQFNQPYNMPQPPAPKQKKRWPLVLGTFIGTFLLAGGCGVAIGMSGESTTTSAEPAAGVTVTATAPGPTVTAEGKAGATKTVTSKPEPAPTVTVTETQQAEAAPEPEEPSGTTMEEGTFEIGVDAPEGRYKTTVPEDEIGCYWERSKDDSGDSIIANELGDAGNKMSVTVNDGEFFKSSGCGTWVKQ